MSTKNLPWLSNSQREIMEIIWAHQEISASSIREILVENKKRNVAKETVRTLLARMEAKGWIEHRVDGRTFLYRAVVLKGTDLGQRVTNFVDEICDGSPERLVNALINHRGLTASEAKKIKAMIDEAKQKKRKPKK